LIAGLLFDYYNQNEKDTYTHLDLKIKATTESVDIKDYLKPDMAKADSCVLTTEQTSASLFRCRYSYIEGRGYALSLA
jgi:hypothetical protein